MGIAATKLTESQRADIARGLFTAKSARGNEIHGLCPLHPDKTPSFSYNKEKDIYNCLACGASGDLADLWMKVNGQTGKEGFKAFCAAAGIESADPWPPVKPAKPSTPSMKKKPPKNKKPATPHAAPELIERSPYLDDIYNQFPPLPDSWVARLVKTRGWSREVIIRTDLRMQTLYQDKKGELCKIRRPERVAIPIKDLKGRVRNLRLYKPGAKKMKIISWGKGYGKSRLFPAKPWMDGPVLLCEGESDVLCALSHGFNAICQTSKLKKWPKAQLAPFRGRDVIIAYDADQPGQGYAAFAGRSLENMASSVRLLQWPELMWPGGSYPDKGGQDLTDFFVRHGKTADDLKALIKQARQPERPVQVSNSAGYLAFFDTGASNSIAFKPRLLAERIIHDHDLLSDPETGILYRWNGQFWATWQDDFIRRECIQHLGVEADSSRVENVLKLVRGLCTVPPERAMNDRTDWLCIKSGMLNLADLSQVPHDKDFFCTYQIPVEFDRACQHQCDRWLKYLSETIQTPAVIDQIQEFAGLCLTRDTRFAKCLFLFGPGADGKSVFIKTLIKLVGEDNTSAVSFAELEKEFNRSAIYNKLLNVSTEVGSKALESPYFKAIASGDTISARFLFKDVFFFRPHCKLVFAANRMPRVLDNSDGFFRRILPVEFKQQFIGADADLDLEEKLEAELSQIFKWALSGLGRLRKQKTFTDCEETQRLLLDYRRSNNPVLEFLEDRLIIGDKYQTTCKELYTAYRNYCKEGGYFELGRANFFRELYAAKGNLTQARPWVNTPEGKKRTRVVKGIGVLFDESDGIA